MITRREFGATLGAAALSAKTTTPQVAITMDDFAWQRIPGSSQPEKSNQAILGTLARHNNLRAALFVIGQNAEREQGKKLARAWCDAGHIIGNHTYSHPALTTESAKTFTQNIERGENVLRDLPTFRKLFRFPALKEGETHEKRDAVRSWLAQHRYRIGHVTIDTSDWYYETRLRARLKENPSFDTKAYHDPYLEHIWECATYYDQLARDVVGRTVSHTLLIHYTLLNVLFLDDLLTMFESKGWQLIPAETAFQDPVFDSKPDVVPAGDSIIWQLATATGKYKSNLENFDNEKKKLERLGL